MILVYSEYYNHADSIESHEFNLSVQTSLLGSLLKEFNNLLAYFVPYLFTHFTYIIITNLLTYILK